MKDKIRCFAEKSKNAVCQAANMLGDLNGDGKLDEEDAKIAAEWAKKTAQSAANEVSKLGKEAMKSDMVKDAAAGAVVGAAIAIPVPVVGPLVGGAIGAGFGLYKNIVKNEASQQKVQIAAPMDVHAELVKFDELRQNGIITDAEFVAKKNTLLQKT